MRSTSRAERTGHRTPRIAIAVVLVAAISSLAPARAAAPQPWTVQGLQDLVLLDTDDGSRVLSRNEGDPAGLARLRLWIAGEIVPGLEGLVVGRIEGGEGTPDGETDAEVDQALLRFVPSARVPLLIDVGKVATPFGNFKDRTFSDVNPLIGAPDGYDVSYPLGAVVTGRVARLDYRLAMLDGPMTNESYVPEAGSAWRPGIGLGVTPMFGLRIGGYATEGPYLGPEVEFALPAGEGWRDFEQRVLGVELKFGRGHFELNGDVAFSRYEVPTTAEVRSGQAWFLEPQYAWTPRLFTALRLERNDYPFIRPVSSTFWIAANAKFYGVEAGLGWRFSPGLVVKGSYRADRWDVDPSRAAMFPDGHVIAVALSYRFDVLSWIERPR